MLGLIVAVVVAVFVLLYERKKRRLAAVAQEKRLIKELAEMVPSDGPRVKLEPGRFVHLQRPHVAVKAVEHSGHGVRLGSSRIGGEPDLAQGTSWPRDRHGKPLSFLAQFVLREVLRYMPDGELPKAGLLSFFYDASQEAWGFDPKDAGMFKVVYTTALDDLRSSAFPKDLVEEARFKQCDLQLSRGGSLPGHESLWFPEELSTAEREVYFELVESTNSGTQILGHASCIQGAMEEECQLVTSGVYLGGDEDEEDDALLAFTPEQKELLKGADQWQLLFQLDSIDDAGMMWGDSGRLYFWITASDLAQRRFDKCWCILQCY